MSKFAIKRFLGSLQSLKFQDVGNNLIYVFNPENDIPYPELHVLKSLFCKHKHVHLFQVYEDHKSYRDYYMHKVCIDCGKRIL